jgi:hypothetical protein
MCCIIFGNAAAAAAAAARRIIMTLQLPPPLQFCSFAERFLAHAGHPSRRRCETMV